MNDPEHAQQPADSICPCRLVAVPPAERAEVESAPKRGVTWHRSQMPWLVRFTWGWVLAGCVLLLAAGIYLKPDPRGHSTHEQLGFAPCGFHVMTGMPCPTCGATTAFAWIVHGHPWMAIQTQPFGAVTALATTALLGLSIVGIVTAGVPAIRLSRRSSVGLALGFLALFVGSWLYKLLVMMAAR